MAIPLYKRTPNYIIVTLSLHYAGLIHIIKINKGYNPWKRYSGTRFKIWGNDHMKLVDSDNALFQ